MRRVEMKKILCFAALIVATSVSAQAKDHGGEIGYQTGELGYDALMSGDNQRAVDDIMKNLDARNADPAKLLNLGRAYARMGRNLDAVRLFQAAIDSNNQFEVELADGRILPVRTAAKLALSQMNGRLASR
jgi:tetratricopeptide (TPR) repeat protein